MSAASSASNASNLPPLSGVELSTTPPFVGGSQPGGNQNVVNNTNAVVSAPLANIGANAATVANNAAHSPVTINVGAPTPPPQLGNHGVSGITATVMDSVKDIGKDEEVKKGLKDCGTKEELKAGLDSVWGRIKNWFARNEDALKNIGIGLAIAAVTATIVALCIIFPPAGALATMAIVLTVGSVGSFATGFALGYGGAQLAVGDDDAKFAKMQTELSTDSGRTRYVDAVKSRQIYYKPKKEAPKAPSKWDDLMKKLNIHDLMKKLNIDKEKGPQEISQDWGDWMGRLDVYKNIREVDIEGLKKTRLEATKNKHGDEFNKTWDPYTSEINKARQALDEEEVELFAKMGWEPKTKEELEKEGLSPDKRAGNYHVNNSKQEEAEAARKAAEAAKKAADSPPKPPRNARNMNVTIEEGQKKNSP